MPPPVQVAIWVGMVRAGNNIFFNFWSWKIDKALYLKDSDPISFWLIEVPVEITVLDGCKK